MGKNERVFSACLKVNQILLKFILIYDLVLWKYYLKPGLLQGEEYLKSQDSTLYKKKTVVYHVYLNGSLSVKIVELKKPSSKIVELKNVAENRRITKRRRKSSN
jgi:hypothetical protein